MIYEVYGLFLRIARFYIDNTWTFSKVQFLYQSQLLTIVLQKTHKILKVFIKMLMVIFLFNHFAQWNLFDVVNSVILKFPAVLKFPVVVSLF